MLKRALLIASALISGGIFGAADAGAGMPPAVFAGKSGAGLAETVAVACRPSTLCPPQAVNITMRDPFTAVEVAIKNGTLPPTHRPATVVQTDWWSYLGAYGDTIQADLINLLPLTPETILTRADFPPGYVTDTTFDNGIWRAGTATLYDIRTNLYEPPVELRGRLARTIFYMALVYHTNLWSPRGFMMFTSAPYPGLTAYAQKLLMEWHREYPPTSAEIELNRMAERLQGNSNPFADYPDLAEYLWGTRQGEAYAVADEPVPLHGTYHISEPWIYLTVPGIPDGALWTADGNPCGPGRVAPSELGRGEHHLCCTHATMKAYVKINITD